MDRLMCLQCGLVEGPDADPLFCPLCGEPLFVAPRPGRRALPGPGAGTGLDRFIDFLPLASIDPGLSLGEGQTPLLRLSRMGSRLGVPLLYAKDETRNPTGSFKDRGTAVVVQKAVSSGARRIGTVSTGNMAVSTAAYGARAGLETFILLKEGTSDVTLRAAGLYGARLVIVAGDYGRLYALSLEIGRSLGISFFNSVDPYRVEGYKAASLEIFLQLGRRAPRFIVVPVSSGGHLLGLMRAFEDLERDGAIRGFPRFVGVQAEGCAPLVRAFDAGRTAYERLDRARTLAHAISNPAPPAGNAVLRMIREKDGRLISVSDEEMLEAQKDLADAEGIFCQPESAAAAAALRRMAVRGEIGPGEDAVLVLTGGGLKALQVLEKHALRTHEAPLSGLASKLRDLIGPEM